MIIMVIAFAHGMAWSGSVLYKNGIVNVKTTKPISDREGVIYWDCVKTVNSRMSSGTYMRQ